MESGDIWDSQLLAIMSAGALGAACGGALGAWLARAPFWKGPVILAVAWMVSSLVVSLLAVFFGTEETVNSIVGTVSFLVVAGLCASMLKVPRRATAMVILGGLLGALLFGYLFIFAVHPR